MFSNLAGIDIHYHAYPDAYFRKLNAYDAGALYKDFNYAVLLRSHLGSTVEIASLCQAKGLPVLGSVCLNKIAGGISHKNVMHALACYGNQSPFRLLVDLPTIRPTQHKSKLARNLINKEYQRFIFQKERLFSKNKIKKSAIDLLKLSIDYPLLISTGHATKIEIFALIEEAIKLGVKKLLINQPANPITNLKYQELVELSRHEFIYFEQTFLTRSLNYQTDADFQNVLSNLPRLIYSSDLGQESQPGISEWFGLSEEWFSKFDLSTRRRREICLMNPLEILKI